VFGLFAYRYNIQNGIHHFIITNCSIIVVQFLKATYHSQTIVTQIRIETIVPLPLNSTKATVDLSGKSSWDILATSNEIVHYQYVIQARSNMQTT
jgi:hypothetical protein